MPKKKTAIDNQSKNSGDQSGRDGKGRFTQGHTLGFQPGQSGNPKGRPKTLTLSEAYRQALAEVIPDDADQRTYAQAIAEMVIGEAVKGNVQAAREIADRTEGKPKQAIDMTANVHDWRELARANGLSEQDVLLEAQRLIQSALSSGGA